MRPAWSRKSARRAATSSWHCCTISLMPATQERRAMARASRERKLREHLGRDRLRLDPERIGLGRIAPDPDARLECLDRECTVLLQMMRDVEAGALRPRHRRLD